MSIKVSITLNYLKWSVYFGVKKGLRYVKFLEMWAKSFYIVFLMLSTTNIVKWLNIAILISIQYNFNGILYKG